MAKMMFAVGLALIAGTVVADPEWSQAEEAALQALLASKAARERRQSPNQPEISTENGEVTIIAGADGKHIAYEIDGVRTNIDEIPAAARDFSAATAGTLQVGYNMGKTTKTVTDTCGRLLDKMEASIDGDIQTLKDGLQEVEVSSAALKESVSESVNTLQTNINTKIGDTQKDLNSAVDAKVKTLEATVDEKLLSTNEYVEKAKACAAEGQGVSVVDGKLTCIDAKPTADANAACDDANEGKISIRSVKTGDFTSPSALLCMEKEWKVIMQTVSAEAKAYGKTAGKKASSCAKILVNNPQAESGIYYVTQSNNAVYAVYCNMEKKYRNGGWQLLLTLTHPRNMFGGSRHPLGSANINSNSPNPATAYARNWQGVNRPAVGDEFLLIAKPEDIWKTLTMSHAHCGWASRDTGVCSGCHGTYAKGQIYNEDGSKVSCGSSGCWLNSCSVCGGCQSRGCDTIGFNADHGDYNAFYGGSQWKAFGSGWQGGNCGGGWDRRKYEGVFPLGLYWRPKKI